jgi:hypothetical protein
MKDPSSNSENRTDDLARTENPESLCEAVGNRQQRLMPIVIPIDQILDRNQDLKCRFDIDSAQHQKQ